MSPAHYEESIANALIGLLRKNTIESIKLIDICRESRVSKTSFYRHFRDKYDVMEYILFEYWNCFEAVLGKVACASFRETASHTLAKLYEHRETLQRVWLYKGQNCVLESVFNILLEDFCNYSEEQPDEILVEEYRGYIFAVMGLLDGWFRNGIDFTAERYTDIIVRLCPEDVIQYLRR